MRLSASQLETVALCPRKWLGSYPLRLPIYKKSYFGFGSCLHGAAERYLLGKPDLFPEGWDIDPDTKVRLSPADAGLVRVLIAKGIEAGSLERRPDGLVEQWFSLPAGQHTVVGKIDYYSLAARTIEDHKTGKNDRYMKKTGRGLVDNLQLQIYSKHLIELVRKRGEPDPQVIQLIHNQYWKEPEPGVRRICGETTTMITEAFWKDQVMPLVSLAQDVSGASDFLDAPAGPEDACNAYGGCPFLTLCSGAENILNYRARINTMNEQQKNAAPPPMSKIEDFLKKRAGASAPASPAPVVVNPPTAPAAPAAPTAPVSTPPWHSPKCPNCMPTGKNGKTPGFKKEDGTQCRICTGMSGVSSSDYEWAAQADGSVKWWKKGAKETTVATTVAPPPVVDAGTRVTTINTLTANLQAAKTVDEAVGLLGSAVEALGEGSPELEIWSAALEKRIEQLTAPAPAAPTAPAEDPAVEERKRGRPKGSKNKQKEVDATPAEAPAPAAEPAEAPKKTGGFVLMLGCAPLSRSFPFMPTVLAEELLLNLDEGYWADTQAFSRRDRIRALVQDQAVRASKIDGTVIVCAGRNPDTDNLVSALMPFASIIVTSTAV